MNISVYQIARDSRFLCNLGDDLGYWNAVLETIPYEASRLVQNRQFVLSNIMHGGTKAIGNCMKMFRDYRHFRALILSVSAQSRKMIMSRKPKIVFTA
jgi:hypothetical protein